MLFESSLLLANSSGADPDRATVVRVVAVVVGALPNWSVCSKWPPCLREPTLEFPAGGLFDSVEEIGFDCADGDSSLSEGPFLDCSSSE